MRLKKIELNDILKLIPEIQTDAKIDIQFIPSCGMKSNNIINCKEGLTVIIFAAASSHDDFTLNLENGSIVIISNISETDLKFNNYRFKPNGAPAGITNPVIVQSGKICFGYKFLSTPPGASSESLFSKIFTIDPVIESLNLES